jgi:hypothetical protein
MRNIYIISKLLIVFIFVGAAIFLAFKGTYSESLNGIIAGTALIESFIIAEYEMRGVQR